ncbi:MAG: ribonuclease HII [Pseudomonadota bacterium]
MLKLNFPKEDSRFIERSLSRQGLRYIAGVDEAGRGPLAGPVVAAAVILPFQGDLDCIADSKVLSPRRREACDEIIRRHAVAIGIGVVDAEDIDRINILQSTIKAMQLAISQLSPEPDFILIDGNMPVPASVPQQTVPGGDARSISIGAASIIAKVHRDCLMEAYHLQYPLYNFSTHKGYATKEHLEAIRKHGHCPLHRRTFRGVKEYLTGDSPRLFPPDISKQTESLDLFEFKKQDG